MSDNLSRNYVRVLKSVNGKLPDLSGSIKQQAWAYRIRDYYIENCRFSISIIKYCRTASYWCDNKVELIGDSDLQPLKLPNLKGSKSDVIRAYSVREVFANRFPDVPFLWSQKDASFWVDNSEFIDCLLTTGLSMDKHKEKPPLPSSENVDSINLNHYAGLSPLQANAAADALSMVI